MTDTETIIEAPMPTNVIQALARVQAEIGGIERLTPAQRAKRGLGTADAGINYSYRGIDQIASEAQPLLGKYGVVIVPSVIDSEATPISKGSGTSWYRQQVEVHWAIYGPGGVNDVISSVTVGVGDDNSDKGMNKAMTAAFKNLLLRILCIGDPNDDTDNYRHTDDDRPAARGQNVSAGDLPPGDDNEWAAILKTLKAKDKLILTRYASAVGAPGFNSPGEFTGLLIQAAKNVLAGREPQDGGDEQKAEPTPDVPDQQVDEPVTEPVAEPTPEPEPEPAKPAGRKPGRSGGDHVHTYVNEVCTICGESEPF